MGLLPKAHCGPKVHHCLRVVRDAGLRRTGVGNGPKLLHRFRCCWVAFDGEEAGKDTAGVAIQDGVAQAPRERQDGACRRSADAGKRLKRLDLTRDVADALLHDDAGGAMEISPSSVIAEAGP